MTGVDGDADGDGISNGAENFFGTDPSVFSQGVVEVAKSGNTFTFQHPQNPTPASDMTAAYRWSTTLGTWFADGASDGTNTVTFSPALDTPSAGTTTVTATMTVTAGGAPVELPALFTDIEVTQP